MAQATGTPSGATFAYEIAEKSLNDQLRRIDAQDSKAGMVIAAGGVFAGFLFSGASFLASAPRPLLAITGMLISGGVISALLAFLNQDYVTAPNAVAVARFAGRDEAWLKWRFLGNLHRVLAWNQRKLNRKTRLLTVGQASLITAVLLVGGYFVWTAVIDWFGR